MRNSPASGAAAVLAGVMVIALGAASTVGLSAAAGDRSLAAARPEPPEPAIEWFEVSGRLNERGRELAALLRRGAPGGPIPPRSLQREIAALLDRPVAPAERERANRMLTRALLELSRGAATGHVSPNVEYLDETLAPTPPDTEFVLARARAAPSLSVHFEALEPDNPVYAALKDGLRRYRERWSLFPASHVPAGRPLDVGERGPEVDALFRRLGFVHPAGHRFDESLAALLREFQAVHGLRATGQADRETLTALNRGSAHYEAIIAANLERARWLPHEPGRKFVLVNTAAAELLAYQDGHPALRMKVALGTKQRPTPALADRIESIVANPAWNVPPHLVRSAIAPNVLRGGLPYLEDNGFVVLSDWSAHAVAADPAKVDWQAVSEGRAFARVRQEQGPGNPMGDMKFMFPNRLGIYLHDTPNPEPFGGQLRYVSNGCIRLEDAGALAAFLASPRDLPQTAGPRREIVLEDSVPVYSAHFTFWSEGETLVFHPDVYEKDPVLITRLGY